MNGHPWDNPDHDIAADLRAAAATEPQPYQPTEYCCDFGHRVVICIGDGALIEHTKQAHPDEARALGWLT